MSRGFTRSDRVAQMTKQEELIAKKRQEFLAKQKTSELGKAVAAAQIKVKKEEPEPELPSIPTTISINPENIASSVSKSAELLAAACIPTPQNNFCNDGSFFEHFKKILESNKIPVKEDIITEENSTEKIVIKIEETDCKEESQPSHSGNNSDSNSIILQNIGSGSNSGTNSIKSEGSNKQLFSNNDGTSPILQNPVCSVQQQASQQQTHLQLSPATALQFNPNIPPPNLTSSVISSSAPPPQQQPTASPSMFMMQQIRPTTSFQSLSYQQTQLVPPPPPPPPSESPPKIKKEPSPTLQEQGDNKSVDPLNILPTSVDQLIKLVVENGDAYEEYIQSRKNDVHPSMWFLFEMDSDEYSIYRRSVLRIREQNRRRNAIYKTESNDEKYDPESVIDDNNDSDDEYNRTILNRNTNNLKRRIETRVEFEAEEEAARLKKRKSRWGDKIIDEQQQQNSPSPSSTLTSSSSPSILATVQTSFANQNKPLLGIIQRTDPALLQYARINYGSINLTEDDWNKCEEHFKVNLLYQDMMRKRQEIDQLAKSGKFKYEYDSDEDTAGGTWEHKLRNAEMEATEAWADALTAQSEGKHHIGDFLPPEELKKFMEQYEAKKNNRMPDLSDYKEYKLKEDNKGFQMLQKLGWQEGQGLGAGGEGIIDPVNKALQRQGNQGLGVGSVSTPEDCDNEYEAYRKRMMLAYRFRPNPLNNPRRAYY